jgi:hexosaminidase
MKYLYLLLLVLFASCGTTQEVPVLDSISIVPRPSMVEITNGSYSLDDKISIAAVSLESQNIARFLAEYLTTINIETKTIENPNKDAAIRLSLTKEVGLTNEAYQLAIDKNGISIVASSGSGLFYGVQSLIQIISTSGTTLPQLAINDKPRFSYRGMHLDVARHMFPVEFIKKYIDMMSHFKYNTFHWHFTEDQGWRIEIKKYPLLQEISSQRKNTVIGRASTRTRDQAVYDSTAYGGYYTQEQIKEVVAYAAERYITVIPEIELPGHSQAALAAYPHLGCTGGPYETATTWGVFDDIYCAGKESTFEFLEDVFDEVIPLFPGEYVHIGGDESPKAKWEDCPHCQKRIKDEGLDDEHELQSYFVQRMEKYLNKKGKTMIGWDEILEGGLAPNAVVMSWRGEDGGIDAAKQNHEVIMTPVKWCYFDYYQADRDSEPLAIGGMNTVENVYGYEPIPSELDSVEAQLILGAQCNLWSEYIKSGDYAEYMVYPRALAMSEVLWSPEESKHYESFVKRTSDIRPLLDQWEINYATHIFESK